MQDEVRSSSSARDACLCFIVLSSLQVCDAAGFSEGFSITSGVQRNLARAIPLHLKHASALYGEEVKTFHCVDCRSIVVPVASQPH
jgi:hypothetical protein